MEKIRTTIYISPVLWEKFKEIAVRDRMKMSNIIEDFVRDWVYIKGSGNPQRPLTAFVKGHGDEVALRRNEIFKVLVARAKLQEGEIRYREIVENLMDVPGTKRVTLAGVIAKDLKNQGVRILY